MNAERKGIRFFPGLKKRLRRFCHTTTTELPPARYQEIYDFFQPVLKKVEQAYFPPDSPAQINHKGLQGLQGYRPDLQNQQGFRRADEYLKEAGVSEERIVRLYEESGIRKKAHSDGRQILDFQDPDQAAVYIAQQEEPFDEALQKSVDESLPYGFNRHRLDHRAYVAAVSQWLLKHAQQYNPDINRQSLVLAAIAAIAHDYGILESRGVHSLLSIIKLKQDNPGIEKDPRFARLAVDIIVHDPPRLKEYLQKKGAIKEDGTIDPDKAVGIMRDTLPKEALAIIGADRGNFDPQRVPEGLNSPEAFEKDPNIFPNMVWTARPAIFDTTYCMNMYFNPFIDPRGIHAWAGRKSKRADFIGSLRVTVPQHVRDALKQHGIPYSVTAEKDWMKIYGKDYLTIQIAAIFALNPHLQNFQLIMHDPFMPDAISRNGQLKQRIHAFRRGHIAEDLRRYQQELESFSTTQTKNE